MKAPVEQDLEVDEDDVHLVIPADQVEAFERAAFALFDELLDRPPAPAAAAVGSRR